MKDRLRQFLTVFLTVSTLVMVGLAIYIPLGGHDSGYISDRFYSHITPAGWAFSIWALIYTGLAAFAVWQALPAQRENARLRAAGPWILGIVITNGIWLPVWQYGHVLWALAIIAAYLCCCIKTMDAFHRHDRVNHGAELWLGFVLFSIYAGWVTIATVLNVTVYLVSQGFQLGLPDDSWGVIVLTVAFGIGWFLFNRWRSPYYILVFAWGYAAIVSAHAMHPTVQMLSLILAVLSVCLAVYGWARRGALTSKGDFPDAGQLQKA